jgi:hypothetical protein
MFTSERAYRDLREMIDQHLVQRLGNAGVNMRR